MKDGVLDRIFANMSVEDRLRFADIDKEMNEAVMRWSDVDSLFIDEKQLIIGSKTTKCLFQKETNGNIGILKYVLETFTNIARIIVQKRLNPDEWLVLKMNSKTTLKKLIISTENFLSSPVDLPFRNLHSLNVLQSLDEPITFSNFFLPESLSLCTNIHRLCLTGILLPWESLEAIFSLPRLDSLDMIGAAVELFKMGDLSSLGCPVNLDEVSLPPSLFSFSTETVNKESRLDFKWLKVPSISVYMIRYDKNQFWRDISRFPKEMKYLIVHGNYRMLKGCSELKKKRGFKIMFGPDLSQVMDPSFCPSSCKLLSHYVRTPPYATEATVRFGDKWKLDVKKATAIPKAKKSTPSSVSGVRRGIRGRSRSRRNGVVQRRHLRRRAAPRERSPDLNTAISPSRNAEVRPRDPSPDLRTAVAPDQPVANLASVVMGIPDAAQPAPPPTPGEPTDEDAVNAIVDLVVGTVARRMEELNAE